MEEYEIEKFFKELGLFQLEDVLCYINIKTEENGEIERRWNYSDSREKISFSEKKQLENWRREASKTKEENQKSIETCRTYLNELVKFSPKLLLEYISLIVNEYENFPFITFFNVSTSRYESMNQLLRMYMTNFITNNPSDLFRNYCSDNWKEYHLLLPEVLEGHWYTEHQPYLCFPRGKKVSVLDLDKGGRLSPKLSAFPYLEEEMKKLVNYRISHYELSQKAVLQHLIDEKKGGQKVYQKDINT